MTKPTLVLLHGVGLDHSMWAPVADLLAADFDVVTPDLPGHGSRPPAPAGVTLSDLADGVVGEVPHGSHLVGFSLGALVAQHLAPHRPELVRTLTSVSSVCRRTPAEREAVLGRLRDGRGRLRRRHGARRCSGGTTAPTSLRPSSSAPAPRCWPTT